MPLLAEPSRALVLAVPSVRRGQLPPLGSRPPPCTAFLLDPGYFVFLASTSRAAASSMVSTTLARQVLGTLSEPAQISFLIQFSVECLCSDVVDPLWCSYVPKASP